MAQSYEKDMMNQMGEFTEGEMDEKYLTFFLDQQVFGIAIADVVQIVEMQEIIPIPEFPSYAKGIMKLRETSIPLIDMRLRLGKKEGTYNKRTCIIVINRKEHDIGLIVDEIDEVIAVPQDAIVSPAQMPENSADYLLGIAKLQSKIALLIDTRKILGEDALGILVSTSHE